MCSVDKFVPSTLFLLLFTGMIHAQSMSEVIGSSGCLNDAISGAVICSPPFGTILKDSLGLTVCGPGACTKGALGDVKCAREPGGFVAKDILGTIVCSGGCVVAEAAYCEKLTQ